MTEHTQDGEALARQAITEAMRTERIYNNTQLAELAGIKSPETVSDFIKGRRDWPSADTIGKIEGALHLPVGMLDALATEDQEWIEAHAERVARPTAELAAVPSVELLVELLARERGR